MSGIVGIYYLDGRPVERSEIQGMLNTISHRGPDGSGIWTDGSIGLGHQMLHTTPESLHEKLPLTNKTGTLTITADARIDNRDELFRALDFNGRPRETIPDSEVILAAYEKWGEQCPEKLLGDFAFAIWDSKNQRLLCARDPIGIKPFFYYFDGKTFYWGSDPRTIYEDSKISKEPNLQLICLYLLNRFDEREETLYKNIYRLPGSQYIVLQNGEIRKGQYWDVDPDYSIRYKTDEQYAEHFLSIFKDSVKARLRSNGPVGALLSGGLDSSSIVCTAQLIYRETSIPNNGFETFSMVFDDLPCDERQYIREVEKKEGILTNYFVYEKQNYQTNFEEIQNYCDVGYFPTLISYAPVFHCAQGKNVRVMLDGMGGDSLLSTGFIRLADLISPRRIFQFFRQLRHSATLSSSRTSLFFLAYSIKPLVPVGVRQALKHVLKTIPRKDSIPSWINSDFLKRNGIHEQLERVNQVKHFPTVSQEGVYRGLFWGRNSNVALLEIGKFISLFSIEDRHPFYDTRLIKFLIAIPEEQRGRAEWAKYILHNAMNGILPELIRMRNDKAEFSCTIDREFKRQTCEIRKLIQRSVLKSANLIYPTPILDLFQGYLEGKQIDDNRNTLENLIWLELQCRSILKNQTEGNNGKNKEK